VIGATRKSAQLIGVSTEGTVFNFTQMSISEHLTPALLTEAITGVGRTPKIPDPYPSHYAAQVRPRALSSGALLKLPSKKYF
jgi:hypothetical protein